VATQLQLTNISYHIELHNGIPGREDQKHLERFEMWCRRRVEKTSWTDRVRNEEVLQRVKEARNIIHAIRRGKANWIGHHFRWN
jgi:hypothetical protein